LAQADSLQVVDLGDSPYRKLNIDCALIKKENFTPQQAISAGFLVQVVSASDILNAVGIKALALPLLNMPACAATKLLIAGPLTAVCRG
jgi:hypothetical protein